MVLVPWITARRRSLARAVAIYASERGGKPWHQLTQATRDKLVDEADKALVEWIAGDVMIGFMREYAESEGGGDDPVQKR